MVPEKPATATPSLPDSPEAPPVIDAPRWRSGRALFRVPRRMWAETAELAELRLSDTEILTVDMRAELERSMTGRGIRTDEHGVEPVGRKMRAVLFGDPQYFEIVPLGSEDQSLRDGHPMRWDWRVVPKVEGHSLLTLRLTMLADADGTEMAVDAQALHTSIEVAVRSPLTRPARFVRDNWKWLLGGSGLGAVATIAALLGG